ncbi:MAG: methyltransferase domain-containing protein [Planctomycetota bacterium]|jgi:hypothetical protein
MPVPVVELELPAPAGELFPGRIRSLLMEAGTRMAAFFERRGGRPVPGFVPGDFERIGRALQALRNANLAAGDSFCEWGSGFGVVALLAAQLEFRACGIEIDADLVEESRALAEDFDLDVEFVQGTFVPRGGEDLTDVPQDFGWLLGGGPCGHEALDLDPSDFDVIFAYPWPGEEKVIEDLFERYAADSALLLTYHGYEDLRLRRKVAAPGER